MDKKSYYVCFESGLINQASRPGSPWIVRPERWAMAATRQEGPFATWAEAFKRCLARRGVQAPGETMVG